MSQGDEREKAIAALDADGCGLRVVFVRHGDRFSHRIEYAEGERVVALLCSVEGSDQQAWPPSPPLQQLSIEERPEGNVALLVGMAGRSHWSASIEAHVAARRLVFDIACRCPHPPERLATTYRLGAEPAIITSTGAQWSAGSGIANLTTDAETAGGGPGRLIGEADRTLAIQPSGAIRPGTTIRWRYEVEHIHGPSMSRARHPR